MASTPTVTTFLWFDGQAEQAVELYKSLIPDTKVLDVSRYDATGPGPKGQVMTVTFELGGQRLIAFNGGPTFKFNEAMSLMVTCETQAEVDRLWAGLTRGGGQEGRCGWLKDPFGVSWQIVPTALARLAQDPDPAKSKRVLDAMMTMHKLDVAELERAHQGA